MRADRCPHCGLNVVEGPPQPKPTPEQLAKWTRLLRDGRMPHEVAQALETREISIAEALKQIDA